MAKVQPFSSTPPMSRTMAGMMVEIMFSAPAWKVTPRLMKQKRGSAPERHNAAQSARAALSSVMTGLQFYRRSDAHR
jgi:hypothetical protein